MPSKSKRQARFMAAAAHDAGFAKKAGIPQKVAEEFNRADERRKPSKGRELALTPRGMHLR